MSEHLRDKARERTPSLFLLLLCIFFLLTSCSEQSKQQRVVHGRTMGTTYSVKVVISADNEFTEERIKALAEEVFAAVNDSMSTYIEASELSQWNRGSDQWVSVSWQLFQVLALGQQISEKSHGAFDYTVMPLVNAWGFGPQKGESPPTAAELKHAKSLVGFEQVELGQVGQVRKPKHVHVDLSAIAKGFGADQLAARLRNEGLRDYMVEVGGELVLSGHNLQGRPWRIGIETPNYDLLSAPAAPAAAVSLTDVGMATSGDYRNYYEVNGKRISHTIDPIKGEPITHNLASVTVIAPTCAEADGWATALNVMGAEKAIALAEQENLAAFFIVKADNKFETSYTHSFKSYLSE